MNDKKILFAQQSLLLNSEGALFWPEKKCLVIADLHLEKGSYLAALGSPIPLYDTHDTLKRLEKLINFYEPSTVICLGDNFHDAKAWQRMSHKDCNYLQSLHSEKVSLKWVVGNHDIKMKEEPFHFFQKIKLDQITFRHELSARTKVQIIGHYHPKIRVQLAGARVSGKCFVIAKDLIIMPAFGAYTGGLNVDATVFVQMQRSFRFYLLHKQQVWCVK